MTDSAIRLQFDYWQETARDITPEMFPAWRVCAKVFSAREKKMAFYLEHRPTCSFRKKAVCNCGLNVLIEELEAAE